MQSATTNNKLSRAEQARLNGSKSKGPITAEGKSASSRNALKHGFSAKKHRLLDVEDSAEFHTVLEETIQEFRPHSIPMLRMAESLHELEWTLARLRSLETAYLNIEVNRVLLGQTELPNPVEHFKETGDPVIAMLLGWINSTGGKGNMSDLMRRYSITLQSKYNQTLNNYLKLEKRHARFRMTPEFTEPYEKPIPVQNEPTSGVEDAQTPSEPAIAATTTTTSATPEAPAEPAAAVAETPVITPAPEPPLPSPASDIKIDNASRLILLLRKPHAA